MKTLNKNWGIQERERILLINSTLKSCREQLLGKPTISRENVKRLKVNVVKDASNYDDSPQFSETLLY